MNTAREADPKLVKLVLQVIESQNLSRTQVPGLDTIVFKSEYQNLFPEDKRLALRKKWDNLRRLGIEGYYKLLLESGVTPGTGALLDLENHRKQGISPREDNSSADDSSKGSIDTDKDDIDEESLSAAFEKQLSTSFISPSLRHSTPTQWQHSATLRPARTSSSSLPSPLKTTTRFSSPAMDPQKPPSVVGGISSSTGSLSEFYLIDGSKESPFKFRVNRLFPEKNPFRIEVLRVEKYEHEGFERNIWEFRVTISAQHYEKWEAFFRPPNFVVIKGPSTDYWTKSEIFWKEDCHDYKDKKKYPFPYDQATESANTALELAIEKEPQREYNWWEFEIPKVKDEDTEATLDNSVFSGPSDVIKKGIRKLKDPKYGLHAVVVYWKIAEAGAIQTKRQNNNIDVKSLLEM